MRKLTVPEKTVLLTVLSNAIDVGDYYGKQSEYYARIQRVFEWAKGLDTKQR